MPQAWLGATMASKGYWLAQASAIPEGKSIVVAGPKGLQIALFKIDGEVYALDNACPHSEGPLGEGELERSVVTCPWHAWQFDVTSGECLNMPGCDATVLPIHMENGDIFLRE